MFFTDYLFRDQNLLQLTFNFINLNHCSCRYDISVVGLRVSSLYFLLLFWISIILMCMRKHVYNYFYGPKAQGERKEIEATPLSGAQVALVCFIELTTIIITI